MVDFPTLSAWFRGDLPAQQGASVAPVAVAPPPARMQVFTLVPPGQGTFPARPSAPAMSTVTPTAQMEAGYQPVPADMQRMPDQGRSFGQLAREVARYWGGASAAPAAAPVAGFQQVPVDMQAMPDAPAAAAAPMKGRDVVGVGPTRGASKGLDAVNPNWRYMATSMGDVINILKNVPYVRPVPMRDIAMSQMMRAAQMEFNQAYDSAKTPAERQKAHDLYWRRAASYLGQVPYMNELVNTGQGLGTYGYNE